MPKKNEKLSRSARKCLAAIANAMLCVVLVGCGAAGTAPTVPAAGEVKVDGQPLANVNVTFTPSAGRSATAQTDGDGKFTLSTFAEGDGAVEGTHKVTFSISTADVPMPGTPEAESYVPPSLPFPEKYKGLDTTDLKVTLPSGGDTAIAIDLTTE